MSITRNLKNYKPTRFMEKTSHYDTDAADYAVMFIESLCHTKGTWARKPFELIDWQEQIIRDIFGVLKPNGYRQFNTAYIEIPKKQGKSELAAAVALLLTCGDGEERAEVYGCAADRQQASIVFNVAADMVRMCPALSKRVKILDSQKRLIYQPTGSIYQVLSADVGNKHGFNTHGVVFDELHTQPNRKLFDVMTKGSGDVRMDNERTAVITIGDEEYTLLLTTKATKEIAGRYGGLENLGEKLMKSENFEMAIGEIVWLITLLANQSILVHNLKDKEHPKELLTEDVVELLTTPLDLAGYKTAITEALYKGTKRNVESEKDSKNAPVG